MKEEISFLNMAEKFNFIFLGRNDQGQDTPGSDVLGTMEVKRDDGSALTYELLIMNESSYSK